ncbi:MAG: hypothetical protein VXW65_02040 [Pseudomonadota bacterium]|nr:hypothetical protein [Pseudomonadota bacterium]
MSHPVLNKRHHFLQGMLSAWTIAPSVKIEPHLIKPATYKHNDIPDIEYVAAWRDVGERMTLGVERFKLGCTADV